ncbi:hypothetical protein Tco_0521144 [Tanacetum coccineum]
MAETMEQYMSKTRADYGSGVARPKIEDKDNFELKGQFLKELRTNTFSDSDHEDANEHIEKFLGIVDLFHITNITIDQVMLRAFPMSLTGAKSELQTDAAIRNQGASIKTLEIQIGQMSKVLQERGFGSLPSSTEANPRDQVKSISTTIEADSYLIHHIGSSQYAVSTGQNSTLLYKSRQTTIPFLSRLDNHYCEEEKGTYGPKFAKGYGASHINDIIPRKEKDLASFTLPCYINYICFDNSLVDLRASVSVMPLLTYLNLGLGELAHTKLTVELADRTVKYPKGIAENVLVRIGKVIEEFRTRDEDLDTRIDDYPSYCDDDKKIRINYAHNLKFSCMIGFEFTHVKFFPLLYVNMMSKKYHNSIMKDKMVYKGNNVIGALMNVPIFVGTFSVVTNFAVLENMDAYRDKGMGDVIVGKPFLREVGIKARRFDGMIIIYNGNDDVTYQMVRSHPRFKRHTNEQCNKILPLLKVSEKDEKNGISHAYQKLKGFYQGVLNLGPDYIRNAKTEEWLTRGEEKLKTSLT